MGLMTDDLWDVSREAQPNSTSNGEDIGSRSDYPSTPMRRTAPTAWLWWTCLSPRGVKPKLPVIGHHNLSRLVGMPRKIGVASPRPTKRVEAKP